MPFTKTRDGKYRTPSGRKMTRKQVEAYHSTGGFQRNKKHKPRKKR